MYITLFPDLSGGNAQEYDTTWEGFVTWISELPVYSSKNQCPLIKLGRFGDTRTNNGSMRHDANLYAISGLEGDYDEGVITPERAIELLNLYGVTAVVVTTPSHGIKGNRWRVFAPLSYDTTPEEHHDLTGKLNAVFGGKLSHESFTKSQAFYVGRVEGVDYQVLSASGNTYIDQVELPAMSPVESQGAGTGEPLAMVSKRAQDITLVQSALNNIPNDNQDWEYFNKIGMAVYVATSGSDEGLRLWEEWTAKLRGHATNTPRERWLHFHKSPPTNIGMGTLVQLAGGHKAISPAPQTPVATAPGDMGEGITIGQGWEFFAVPWPDTKSNGKPKGTISNLMCLLNHAGITVRYNLMTKEPEINIPGGVFLRDNHRNNALSTIISLANSVELPVTNIQEFITTLSDRNTYHPIKNWIESTPWDGTDRIAALIASIDPVNPAIASLLIPKWLASGIDAVFRPNGVSAQGCLVLQGAQNLGKTRWFESLVGDQRDSFKEGAILNPNDKDSVKQCIKYWITELGELDATFRKSDISALKAFITRNTDEFRSPYARVESLYPRKTIFAASVNPQAYLHDDTGNRRYWTIEVGKGFTADHGIDVQQVWAQVYATRNSIVHWLNHEEHALLNDVNSEFETPTAVEDLIRENYDMKSPRLRDLSAVQILEEIGIDPGHFNNRTAANIVQKIFGRSRKSNGRMVYSVPVKLTITNKAFR